MLSILLAAAVLCGGVDDTAEIQRAINANTSVDILDQACSINTAQGVRVPTRARVRAAGSTFTALPGCNVAVCWAFRFAGDDIEFQGGTLVGDMAQVTGQRFSEAFQVDGGSNVLIAKTTIKNWRSDGIWIGGTGLGSRDVRISEVWIEGSGRNHISISNGRWITVERSTLAAVQLAPGLLKIDPGAALDVEPNLFEGVDHVVIADNYIYNNQKGLFLQPGKGRPGLDYVVERNDVHGNREWGIAVNSVIGATIVGNVVTGSPIGITVGGATEAVRASSVLVSRNRVSACAEPLRLAGVSDALVVWNQLQGPIPIRQPALGASSAVVMLYNEWAE